jgi:hypothetical protein
MIRGLLEFVVQEVGLTHSPVEHLNQIVVNSWQLVVQPLDENQGPSPNTWSPPLAWVLAPSAS